MTVSEYLYKRDRVETHTTLAGGAIEASLLTSREKLVFAEGVFVQELKDERTFGGLCDAWGDKLLSDKIPKGIEDLLSPSQALSVYADMRDEIIATCPVKRNWLKQLVCKQDRWDSLQINAIVEKYKLTFYRHQIQVRETNITLAHMYDTCTPKHAHNTAHSTQQNKDTHTHTHRDT